MRRLTEEYRITFPDPRNADAHGFVGWGGNLSPGVLLSAYEQGIFPWYEEEPIQWFSPDPRFVLRPGEFRLSRRFARSLKNSDYQITANNDFAAVVASCRSAKRAGQRGTWITAEMQRAYEELHRLGHAYSVEVYRGNQLAGGLYGVVVGGLVGGESMFSREPGASKFALAALVEFLHSQRVAFLDCQVSTDHLRAFGAREIPRDDFLSAVPALLSQSIDGGAWETFDWCLLRSTLLTRCQ